MGTPGGIESVIVEYQRFGEAAGLFRHGERYLMTRGWNEPVVEREMPLNQKEFLENLNQLRYLGTRSDAEAALGTLSEHASEILPAIPEGTPDKIVQVDLVAGAAELWAFPFEACRRNGEPVFASRERPVVLTRRIRQGFADRTTSWPVRPSVLFAHAPASPDLPQSLIDEHIDALTRALSPWTAGAVGDLLTVKGIWDVSELEKLSAETTLHARTHSCAWQVVQSAGTLSSSLLGPAAGTSRRRVDLAQGTGRSDRRRRRRSATACRSDDRGLRRCESSGDGASGA